MHGPLCLNTTVLLTGGSLQVIIYKGLKKKQHNARKTNASQRNAELTSRNQLCLSVKTGCFFDSWLVVTRSFHETQI